MVFSQGRITVDEYSNQFLLIAANTDISDKEQVPYFQRGLDPKVVDKIYDKETPPKDTIQDWVNMACKVDGRMRAWNTQKAILANSTSFQSDFLNCFHLQNTPCYTSSNAPRRMANQVVDMNIDASWKRSADCQKCTHSGKLLSPCYNCGKTGHWNSNCLSPPLRSVPVSRGNMHRKMGGGGRHTCVVDMGDEDNEGPTMGNQVGICQGVAKEHSDHNDQWIPQPGRSMECGDPSTGTHQPTLRNRKCDVLPDGWRTNGPVSHGARVRVIFEELGDEEQKELLVDLAQDFTWPLPH